MVKIDVRAEIARAGQLLERGDFVRMPWHGDDSDVYRVTDVRADGHVQVYRYGWSELEGHYFAPHAFERVKTNLLANVAVPVFRPQ